MPIYGAINYGLKGKLIKFEAASNDDIRFSIKLTGLTSYSITGGIERIKRAIDSSKPHIDMPQGKYSLNLIPGDIVLGNTILLDLPIALSVLLNSTSKELKAKNNEKNEIFSDNEEDIDKTIKEILAIEEVLSKTDILFVGGLNFDGTLHAPDTAPILPVLSAVKDNFVLIVPEEIKNIAWLGVKSTDTKNVLLYGLNTLRDVYDFLLKRKNYKDITKKDIKGKLIRKVIKEYIDFKDIHGQNLAKRALEVAAAGGHNVLLYGPPGEGKNMLASALRSILPDPSEDEIFEINNIYSARGELKNNEIILDRPFREVHSKGVTRPAMFGGGSYNNIRPGEVSAAHRGVLFLDELQSFDREMLESLREPLQNKTIRISRHGSSEVLKCEFTLIGAMNPCKCGFYGEYVCSVCGALLNGSKSNCGQHKDARPKHKCKCTKSEVKSYQTKLSGPLLQRIDIKVRVLTVDYDLRIQRKNIKVETSSQIKERVKLARDKQRDRYKGQSFRLNCEIPHNAISWINISEIAIDTYKKIMKQYSLHFRSSEQLLKIARTIADLDGKDKLMPEHINQAIGLMGIEDLFSIDPQYSFDNINNEIDTIDEENVIPKLRGVARKIITTKRLNNVQASREIGISSSALADFLDCKTKTTREIFTKLHDWAKKNT